MRENENAFSKLRMDLQKWTRSRPAGITKPDCQDHGANKQQGEDGEGISTISELADQTCEKPEHDEAEKGGDWPPQVPWSRESPKQCAQGGVEPDERIEVA